MLLKNVGSGCRRLLTRWYSKLIVCWYVLMHIVIMICEDVLQGRVDDKYCMNVSGCLIPFVGQRKKFLCYHFCGLTRTIIAVS